MFNQYFWLFILACVLTGLIYHPYFFAPTLFFSANLTPILRKIIQAVIAPRKFLIVTLIFLLSCIYLALLVYYAFYFKDFQSYACDNMLICYFALIDATWKGTTFDLVNFDYSGEETFRVSRFLVDATF